jgi:hypothetical protein
LRADTIKTFSETTLFLEVFRESGDLTVEEGASDVE